MRGVSRLRAVSRAALQARATTVPARAVASVSAATQFVRNRAVQSAVDALADKFSAPKTRVFRDESALDLPTIDVSDDLVDADFAGTAATVVPDFPCPPTANPFELVEDHVHELATGIKTVLTSDHPVLEKVAHYFFDQASGKKLRPALVLLGAMATREDARQAGTALSAAEEQVAWEGQCRLAEITELIHTASLLHDDVLDTAETRRGVDSVNQVFGNKLAVLAGDFLLSRASINLARLRNVEVVEIMSTCIEHLVRGEVMQMRTQGGGEDPFPPYLRKTYYKTASLISHSLLASAVLGRQTPEVQRACFEYGKHAGLAFQLVDDWLDFTANAEQLGKPSCADLRQGILTAPFLYAARDHPHLHDIGARKLSRAGDFDEALRCIHTSGAVDSTLTLARWHAHRALDACHLLAPSPARDAMHAMLEKMLVRQR